MLFFFNTYSSREQRNQVALINRVGAYPQGIEILLLMKMMWLLLFLNQGKQLIR